MWNVVTKDNKNYPDTDRLVVGFFYRERRTIYYSLPIFD